MDVHGPAIMRDRDGDPVYLAAGAWQLNHHMQTNKAITFLKTKELE
jgi:hypothetical protein